MIKSMEKSRFPALRALAARLGEYSSWAAARRIRSVVSAQTPPRPLMTRSTVPLDTPARRAISIMVAMTLTLCPGPVKADFFCFHYIQSGSFVNDSEPSRELFLDGKSFCCYTFCKFAPEAPGKICLAVRERPACRSACTMTNPAQMMVICRLTGIRNGKKGRLYHSSDRSVAGG